MGKLVVVSADSCETPISCSKCVNHFWILIFYPAYVSWKFALAHSSWIVSFCHKLNPLSATFWKASIHTTLWEFVYVDVNEWTFEYTFSIFFLHRLKDLTVKVHCQIVCLTARVKNWDFKTQYEQAEPTVSSIPVTVCWLHKWLIIMSATLAVT
jgi:hypothetical protein